MGARGKAPRPTALKLLHGETRPSRVNHNEPKPSDGEIRCPAKLGAVAKRVWRRLAPDLIRLGVLTPWDVESFAGFCAAVEMRDAAYRGWQESSDAAEAKAHWSVFREATTIITTVGGRFGLNPSDRQQLKVGGGDAGKEAERLLS